MSVIPAFGDKDKIIRSLKSSSDTKQIQDQPGLYEFLSQDVLINLENERRYRWDEGAERNNGRGV